MAEVLPQRQQLRRGDIGALRDRGVRAPKIQVPTAAAQTLGTSTNKLIDLGVKLFFKVQRDNDAAVAATAFQTAVNKERRDSLQPGGQRTMTPLELFGPREDGPPKSIDTLYTESENRLRTFAIQATHGLDEDQKALFFQRWNPHEKTLKDRSAAHLATQQKKFREGVLATQYTAFDTDVSAEATTIEQTGQIDIAPPEVVADRAANAYTEAMRRLNSTLVGKRETADGPLVGGLQHLGASAKELSTRHLAAERRLASAAIRAWYNAHSDDVQALEQLMKNELPNGRLTILFNKLDQKGRDALAADLFRDRTALNRLKDDKAKADRVQLEKDDLAAFSQIVHTPDALTAVQITDARRLLASPHLNEANKKQLEKVLIGGQAQRDNQDHMSMVSREIAQGEINDEDDLADYIAVNKLNISVKTVREKFLVQIKNRADADYRNIRDRAANALGVITGQLTAISEVKINKVASFDEQFSLFFDQNPGLTKDILQEKANELVAELKATGDQGALASIPAMIDAYYEAKAKARDGDKAATDNLKTAFTALRTAARDGNLITPGQEARFRFGQGPTMIEIILEGLDKLEE